MKHLTISPDLNLPLEAVTQTFAILAKRGVGKTYTAAVMVEEMLEQNLHVIVVDPIGVWWWLRADASGKREGLPIIIAGGDHADIPITPNSGELLAEVVVNKKISVVIDLSLFRKGEQIRFMTDFAETLYRHNREAVHLVLDEADAFAPQRGMPDQARLLGAIEDIVRRGRARGIGVTMITQRPAVLNKNVLTQIEVLVVLRLVSPQDRAAVKEWINMNADPDQAATMLESLQALEVGTAWFYSPGWLGLFKKVKVRRRKTLDSSNTPKVGERVRAAEVMAEVDIEGLRDQMATTISEVADNDVGKLKARIREMEARQPEVQRVEVLPTEFMSELQIAIDKASEAYSGLIELRDYAKKFAIASEGDGKIVTQTFVPELPKKVSLQGFPGIPNGTEVTVANGDRSLSKAARALLNVLAQFPGGRTKPQLSILSGYTIKSSSFSKALSELRTAGYINTGEPVQITEAGLHIVGPVDIVPNGEELIEYWINRLGKAEATILRVLIGAWPRQLEYHDIAKESGYSEKSSSFSKALSKLRSLELAEGYGTAKASDIFFEGKP